MAGAFTGAWLVLRDSPPRYVEQWHDGAEGERKTEKALKGLEQGGLHVVHDVEARYGNYDHIAVGHRGVLLLDSKNYQGTIEFRDGMPHLRRGLDPDADMRCDRIRRRALSAAVRLKEDIERRTGRRLWVQAVVVFWCDFPEQLIDDGRCVFVHGSELANWIERRTHVLDPSSVTELSAVLDELAAERALAPSD